MLVFDWQDHIFKDGVGSHFMSEPITIPFASQHTCEFNSIYQPSLCMRICKLAVGREPVVDCRKLLLHKEWCSRVRNKRRLTLPRRQFDSEPHGRLSIAPFSHFAIKTILAGQREITNATLCRIGCCGKSSSAR